ncbi:MAG: DUF4258 domain-containing protein [Blastocatellia bacterium]|nr:DUF4258 domain-containing protein [Blastocatellia bacterium]
MYEDILATLELCVQEGRASLTNHAYDEMEEDGFFVFDLEQCVYTGTIVERQWDDGFQDWKYVVHGKSADGEAIAVVAQIDRNQNLVFITTYRL